MARFLFVVSLLVFAFGYGASTIIWRLWPYETIRDAFHAGNALKRLHELRIHPKTIVSEPAALPEGSIRGIYRHPSREAGEEWLLIAGGPQQHLDLCPRFGCIAWIMDRQGRVLHTWEADPQQLWPEFKLNDETVRPTAFHPTGLHLYDNGDLLVSYANDEIFPVNFGLVRIDRSGGLIWKRLQRSHHWPTMDPADQLLFIPEMEVVPAPLPLGNTGEWLRHCETGKVLEDWVRVLNDSGGLLWEFSIIDVLESSGLHGLLALAKNGCDPTHLNFISIVTDAAAGRLRNATPGDLLVSLRNLNTLAVIGRGDGLIRQVFTGQFNAQHSPIFLRDGRLLVLDNRGGAREQGGTRVLRFDPATATTEQVFPRPGVSSEFLPIRTLWLGHLQMSPDEQRVLFTESRHGRILEFELATGEVVWGYANDHRWAHPDSGAAAEPTRFENVAAYYVDRPGFLSSQDPP